ncbi:hypothetical protein [Arenibacter certesii]|uniref:Uncharacterized protein n=1 Tax=Arenibacter certesii TaxID=228955 RepID=A0A918J074_9FLAO|nr:hypothetical protein [Arenibacter certesii]GGW41278.1 hypothetical protein GCM10007383_27540 [Arenibacter certesii]
MKKTILTTVMITALFINCKDSQDKSNVSTNVESTETIHESVHEDDKMVLNNSWVTEIQLNSGNKWEANIETTEGVENMLELIKENNYKSVGDYHQLASKLNDEKNYVVKECTMTGPSHDNLHVFLHPLIKKIDALGNVNSVENGKVTIKSIKENLDGYYTYFK